MDELEVAEMYEILIKSWSIETSSKWTIENPAKGQCGVTSLVVHDLLGGEIKKTPVGEAWHFYNMINGKRYDFTATQFFEEIVYMDITSNREEAFADTNQRQYYALKQKVHIFMQ
ncbi:hypothetical protein H9I32_20955 [Bacillus sp. Xin]|uniref:YunG family protein n=1 Tax=unclassified Bacillus (in: firmicutes) TaxID=185979 RepID=UPI001573053F|nr:MULTISPECIES: hypothetical protein [unclassified Bacillus (in: firmicutes)]MBC6974766.1 hypothetical protein [Bacillus sp. Xin]NSW37130.1 hypothetical protein [Bacillus sp. Xin1]